MPFGWRLTTTEYTTDYPLQRFKDWEDVRCVKQQNKGYHEPAQSSARM